MSEHADTIRRLRTAADYEYGRLTPDQRMFYREIADALEASEAERKKAIDALREIERDARWIVGQWQRLRDQPLKEVSIAIVKRCVAVTEAEDCHRERQQAIDALRDFAELPKLRRGPEWAFERGPLEAWLERVAALVQLGEQP